MPLRLIERPSLMLHHLAGGKVRSGNCRGLALMNIVIAVTMKSDAQAIEAYAGGRQGKLHAPCAEG
jgi:hypothetical protein